MKKINVLRLIASILLIASLALDIPALFIPLHFGVRMLSLSLLICAIALHAIAFAKRKK